MEDIIIHIYGYKMYVLLKSIFITIVVNVVSVANQTTNLLTSRRKE